MNQQRRHFLKTSALISGLVIARQGMANPSSSDTEWFMPDESEPHLRTWMAFGASRHIWGKKLLPEVQRNLALIANTIGDYEPVHMLVREKEYELAQSLVSSSVKLIESPLDDLWMRDTGPTFVINEQSKKAATDLNFNGWGNKQSHKKDAKVAAFIAEQAGTLVINTDLVLEGGCFEVDGHGTAILTESCVLNKNRNPGVSKTEFEEELMHLLGLDKIVWLPGIKGKDITDGHTDFYVRFVKSGVVVAGYDPDSYSYDHAITKKHIKLLKQARDAQGKQLEVIVLEGPNTVRRAYENNDFAAGYIGYYACNDAIIMQEFGDKKADNNAKSILQEAFPKRDIVQLNVDGIAAGGGSIHCATQQEPKV